MALFPSFFKIQEIETRLTILNQKELALKQESKGMTLQKQLTEMEQVLKQLQSQAEANRHSIKSEDLVLKDCLARIAQEEEKLYSGKIVNPRELEKIQQKISEYRQTQAKIEMQMLDLLEKEESIATQSSTLQNQFMRNRQELDVVQKKIRQQTIELQLEQNDLRTELKLLIPEIPVEWMDRYRKIAASHRGVGIARVKNNACGACHVSLSESLLQKVKRGDDVLYFCENCGRIIYY